MIYGTLNDRTHPTDLFADYGIYFWCGAHTWPVTKYMTATQAHHTAYMNKAPEGVATYNVNNPYMYYRRSSTLGIMRTHRKWWELWVSVIIRRNICGHSDHYYYQNYNNSLDDGRYYEALERFLPGINGNPPKKSIEYNLTETWDVSSKPGAMFVVTQQKVYTNINDMPKDAASDPEPLTEREKELGYFNVDEKQGALWNKKLGVNIGADNGREDLISAGRESAQEEVAGSKSTARKSVANFAMARSGDVPDSVDEGDHYGGEAVEDDAENRDDKSIEDRNLGYIAEHYEEFYKTIQDGGYESIVEVLPVDGYPSEIEESTKSLDGDSCKMYKYKGASIEIDTAAQCYVLGPFNVDYTVDDQNVDIYTSYTGADGKPNQVKYNAIEEIKVFNQNEVDITTLGGSFKVAYEYKGAVTEENEGKLHRISDEYYYELADYEEIPAFESLKPFYIIVYRGGMSLNDFQGFYAKITFQYLKNITGHLYCYEGNVIHYFYTKTEGTYREFEYQGYFSRPGSTSISNCIQVWLNKRPLIKTASYTLNREMSGEKAQRMTGYGLDGNREYDTYSIILTGDWEQPKAASLNLQKTCGADGQPLYGAKYDVTLNVSGTSKSGESINKTITLTGITDENGMLAITATQLEAYGVYLNSMKGTINATFKETQSPAGHVLGTGDTTATFSVNEGSISPSQVQVVNAHAGNPVIQIAKLNSAGNLIEEAMFDIQVRYTNGSGDLVDVKNNVIRGTTKNGALDITRDDLLNMPAGFDIAGYTGKLTLQVIEVAVKASGYSLTPESLSMELEFKNGKLVTYSENTSEEVLVHYLYDDPLTQIYNWAKGNGTLYPYVEHKVNAWIATQQDRTGMTYEDVQAWLAEYIENDRPDDGGDLDEWKVATLAGELTSGTGGDVIRLIVEDTPGDFKLPDIPEIPDNPFLMSFGGRVFLDQTVTKEGEKISDGNLTQGETGLYGVEVTLHEVGGGLAELAEIDGKKGTNPTMTDKNGYYQFKGVDPFKKYYITFRYNGVEYEATNSSEASYNSDAWKVTSKAGETSTGRGNYTTVSASNPAYDYDEIAGIYRAIANYTWDRIISGSYPSWDEVRGYIAGNSGFAKDPDIGKKLDYINNSMAEARAGYSSGNTGGTYPHSSLGDRFMLDADFTNTDDMTVDFAGDTVPTLLAGQMQIHLGLVERDSTDLQLHSDIVETTVSMNRYDTKYEFGKGDSAYHQYIYEEDYNYATTPNSDGIAYYTEDNVHYYITYEIEVSNQTGTNTRLQELINYYNSEFSWRSSYTTTKGNTISGVRAWYGGTEISVGVSAGAGQNGVGTSYKANVVSFGNGYDLVNKGNTIKVQLTYELTGSSDNAREVLKKYLCPDPDDSTRFSKTWDIGNYSEISRYATDGGYLDMDSTPGNFSIAQFEQARKEYQDAYAVWEQNKTDANALKVQLAETRLLTAREDDTWRVGMNLTNHNGVRKISGNVWEAINEEVKSSLDLQSEYGERYLEWSNNPDLALGGIKVELVELLKDGDTENGANQVVRGVTQTKADGSYSFTSYIAGDYTIRFIYGDYANTDEYSSDQNKDGVIYSKVTKNTYADQNEADYLPINGQYYGSTKANPETDTETYWYAEKSYSANKENVTNVKKPRYSDAYDDAYSRLTQMNSSIENAENSTSLEYDYDGDIEVETTRHTDPIYSYTSTMELEIEYIRPDILGNKNESWYRYEIGNIDFGVTPRAYNDVNISRYISHITLYKEGEEKTPVIDVDFDKDGILLNRDTAVGAKYVGDTDDGAIISYKDGVIHVNYEQMVQNRSHLELTYTVDVSNDSLYDANNKVYDTIKYIYSGKDKNKPISVVYYNEPTRELVAFESYGRTTDTLVYHNSLTDDGYSKGLAREDRNQDTTKPAQNQRLATYSLITGLTRDFEGEREIITSRATNIVDYPTQPLDFAKKDHNGNDVNLNWIDTNYEEFVSARENYKIENGEISLIGIPGEENSLVTKSHILRAKDDSPLYKELKPGEVTTDTILLQHTLTTVQSDITGDSVNTDLSALDEEYSNMVEITRLANSAGKIIDIEGYDITGNDAAETSEVRNISDIETELMTRKDDKQVRVSTFNLEETTSKLKLTPTLCTGKSQTTVITPPAGLPEEDSWGAYVGITLVVLVTLAGGIVLIKKYAIVKTPKA